MTRSSKREERKPLEFDRRTAIGAIAGSVAAGMAVPALAQTPDASPVATPAASPVTTEGGGLIQKSSVEGVPDVILEAPQPYASYEGIPASGGEIMYTPLLWAPPATSRDKNTFWQGLEKRLGLDFFNVREVPVETYAEKISALIASNDMGDLLYIHTGIGSAAVINQAISEGAFYDLTDELSGENLQKYPNLARFPEAMWEDSKINGRIYGVPQPLAVGTPMTWYRSDWSANLGLKEPTNAEELYEFLLAFHANDPDGDGKDDTYAQSGYLNSLTGAMFRTPNGWRLNDDGTLTYGIETQEWADSVLYMKRLWDSGMIHPDAPSIETTQMIDLFYSGTTAAMSAGFGTWFGADPGRQDAIQNFDPEATLAPIMPIAHDGGDRWVFPDSSYFGMVSIPMTAATDLERVEMLLRICDYLYPPFGSEEYMYLNYGDEGIHHSVEDGVPVLTPQGHADIANLIYGFLVLDLYIYHPGFPEQALQRQRILEEIVPLFVKNPVQGLFSEVENRLGPQLGELIGNTIDDVVYGREPVEILEQLPAQWRERGGDEVRADYERLLKELEEA